jgi:hypothetical protein
MKLIFKKLLTRLNLHPESYCKKCGSRVRDFAVPDDFWEDVCKHTELNVLCYNCFCNACDKIGYPSVFHLVPQDKELLIDLKRKQYQDCEDAIRAEYKIKILELDRTRRDFYEEMNMLKIHSKERNK